MTHNPAVLAGYDDGGVARGGGAVGDGVRDREVGQRRVAVAGVLDVDEQRPPVGSRRQAGDFASWNAGEQPADRAGARVCHRQSVVEAVILAAVCLDERPPGRVCAQAVRVGEGLLRPVRVGGGAQDLPQERAVRRVSGVAPAEYGVTARGLAARPAPP